MPKNNTRLLTRRQTLKSIGAAAGAGLVMPSIARMAHASTQGPIRLGFEVHRTGIGSSYGRWYERVGTAAAKRINAMGGINGREVEIIAEDDGTDPRRGAEVVERFASLHECDAVFGTLFSHVVFGAAPRAGELKMPYFVISEGYHVAGGLLNRYSFQPGITDVRAQVKAMAPYVSQNLGKKVTMFIPDFAFGHDHRDFFSEAIKNQGGEVLEVIAIPPTETSFTRYFPRIPRDTEMIYHVMVGPAVLTFVRELGEFFGGRGPALFGYIDSLEAVDTASPGLEFLEGSHFWEGMPRFMQPDADAHEKMYREAVGIDENGASVDDPRDISTAGHMFGVWETLSVIKMGMEMSGYQTRADTGSFIEAVESLTKFPLSDDFPQGEKIFNGKTHQVFGHQNISLVEPDGKLKRVHRTSIEDTLYENDVDYTTQSL
ncbi:MAG: ABC transporter substrate-binding protein [Nitratireductor sp.]|nr:ABC transporter substrate-binding protein [Nitratireductor sp.]